MGLLDKLTGTQRPTEGIEAQPPGAVRDALRAVAGPDMPYVVRDPGPEDETAELVADWRVQEPEWQNLFSRTEVDRLVRVLMRLDEQAHEVRALDKMLTVTWRSGVATVAYSREKTRGVVTESSWRRTTGADGGETTWSFSTDELKQPLKEATLACGWSWKGVAFGKL